MAAPTLTLLNSTSINTAESVTNWTKFDTLETDLKKEGSNSITGTFRTDATEGYYDAGSAPVTAVGKTFRAWINTTNLPYMDTEANGGYEFLAYDGTTTEYVTMFGSDTYFGGWFNIVIDMDSLTTLTLANVQRWGLRIQHTASAKNIDNTWTDAYKYLDGYSMTGGTSGDEVTLETIEVADRGTTTLYGYGVLTVFGGVYYGTGTIQFGTGATTTWVLLDGDILVFEDKPVAAGLYSLSGVGAGTRVTVQNSSTITSAGATDDTRFVFDWSDTNLLSFTCTDSLIVRASTSTFKSGQTVTGNTFNECGIITHGGANMNECTVKNYEGTANTSALIYNVAADPDGEMDGMTFEKGTAATHAIEFGLTSPLTMTLRDLTVTSYNAADTQNDSSFHFKRTAGTVTLNLTGFTGNASYRTDGATIVLVVDPVPVGLSGVTEGTPVTIIAAETVGTITEGDVLLADFADSNGEVSLSFDYEGAFDPSGLDVVTTARNQGVVVAAIAADAAVLTDETAEASSVGTNDMTLLPTVPVVNDAYYFGHTEQFNRLKIDVSTVLTQTGAPTLVWEYWNGAWVALSGVTDGTSGFETLGENVVSYTLPGDWVTTTVNSQGPFYYVRVRLSVLGTITQAPKGQTATLDVTRYLPYSGNRTIVSGTGLADIATWTEDTISKFEPTD